MPSTYPSDGTLLSQRSTAIVRKHTSFSLSANTAASTTDIIDYRGFASGSFLVPNGSSITTVTWHVRPSSGSATAAAYDGAATPVAVTQGNLAADRSYPIPTTLLGSDFLYPVTNAAGTLVFSLKG